MRVLAAAEALAREVGPGNMSLDLVAARAGVSKGGLLYHFPNKSALMTALVETFLAQFDAQLHAREASLGAVPNGALAAYLELVVEHQAQKRPPPSGVLAALAEDPDMIAPVRAYERIFLDRIRASASDAVTATIIFLALQGIRSMDLLNTNILNDGEIAQAVARMRTLIG